MVYGSLKFYDLIFTMVYLNCEGIFFISFSQRLRHPSMLADLNTWTNVDIGGVQGQSDEVRAIS